MIAIIILSILIIVAVVGGVFFVRSQISSVRKYIKSELRKLVDIINDAKHNEFNFDKQNEQNIKKLEKQLLEVSAKLESITSMV